eukprot:scaffold60022_cov57-Phaeocystis_antarctica.AAC.2
MGLFKPRLARVSSRPAWGLPVWGSRPVWHTCVRPPPRTRASARRACRAGLCRPAAPCRAASAGVAAGCCARGRS